MRKRSVGDMLDDSRNGLAIVDGKGQGDSHIARKIEDKFRLVQHGKIGDVSPAFIKAGKHSRFLPAEPFDFDAPPTTCFYKSRHVVFGHAINGKLNRTYHILLFFMPLGNKDMINPVQTGFKHRIALIPAAALPHELKAAQKVALT